MNCDGTGVFTEERAHSGGDIAEMVVGNCAGCSECDHRAETQYLVEGVCYYRNLAISLGATPDMMLTPSDRRLAETGLTDAGPGYWSHEDDMRETREMWEAFRDGLST